MDAAELDEVRSRDVNGRKPPESSSTDESLADAGQSTG
jgi:hypothetical protein